MAKQVILKGGEVCPHCLMAQLAHIKAREPYYSEHLQCPKCDSTYNIGEVAVLQIEEPVEGYECPTCHNGTIERVDNELRCRGECGRIWKKEDKRKEQKK